MKLILNILEERMIELTKAAAERNMSIEEYVMSKIFDTPPALVDVNSTTDYLTLENRLKNVVIQERIRITEMEKGTVIKKDSLLPILRRLLDSEQVRVIEELVFSSLEKEGVISVWTNDPLYFEYVRN